MEDVKILKLVTEEEIICKVLGIEEDAFLGKKVLIIQKPFGIAPDPAGRGIMLFPWSIATIKNSNDTVHINLDSVVMLHPAPQELETQYLAKVSGISIATNQEKSVILG